MFERTNSAAALQIWSRGIGLAPGVGRDLDLRFTPRRAWPNEHAVVPRTAEGKRRQRVAAQHLGERIAAQFLRDHGDTDVVPLGGTAMPFDVLTRQHAVEVKTGLVHTTAGSAQWRCSLPALQGSEEARVSRMTEAERSRYMADKRAAMMQRKADAVAEVQRVIPVKPVTIALILDPVVDGALGKVDVFWFEGFHQRLGYRSPEARRAFRGTFLVQEAL